ncbi:hypothetical protein X739_31340 [Mesorhizobium sp. LNHC220B00]|nr:hypothetical protein X739_31340 [Mesorhizobium sp. LNHC220B00]
MIIPLVLAPPFFGYLLGKQRELAIAHRELEQNLITQARILRRRSSLSTPRAVKRGKASRIASQSSGMLRAAAFLRIDFSLEKAFSIDGVDGSCSRRRIAP